jgi:hypothetical protein
MLLQFKIPRFFLAEIFIFPLIDSQTLLISTYESRSFKAAKLFETSTDIALYSVPHLTS